VGGRSVPGLLLRVAKPSSVSWAHIPYSWHQLQAFFVAITGSLSDGNTMSLLYMIHEGYTTTRYAVSDSFDLKSYLLIQVITNSSA
jgi:hypothetical protein